MQRSGLFDKNNKEICEGHKLKNGSQIYLVKYGHGTYDSGYYNYIGFYLAEITRDHPYDWDNDGYANIMFDKDYIEIISE